jgi:cephalosporin-C deacetylase-like acetyl esterase
MIRKYFFTTVCCLAAVFSGKAQLNTDSLVVTNNQKITGFLDRKIVASEAGRAGYWHRDFSSPEAYRKSVETNREQLKFITGVRDVRVSGEPELCAGINRSAVVAETETHTVFAVRWQVFDDFFAEGLFLKPRTDAAKRTVIHLPHAGVSPEQLLGMEASDFDAWFPFPAGDEQMFIPVIVDRKQEKRERIFITNREYVYRAAYQLGRHIIGYEVQETLVLVDRLKQSSPEMKIRVEGQGDGALIAFYAAAMDTRIDEAVVVDYFDRRDRVCDEVIDRNVFGLLQQFGDAEIASLICPRKLTVGMYNAPELTLPENEPWGSAYGGAPGKLQKQPPESVEAEVNRAKKLTAPLRAGWIEYTPRMTRTFRPGVQMTAGLDAAAAADRMNRIVTAMDRHTEHLLDRSVLTRREFWKELNTSSPEKIAETVDWYRNYFSKNIVGEFDDTLLPLNPRVRLVNESETYKVYQVELDVFEGLSAYGLMLVPNSLKEGERLPVILCQHGLERFCSSHVREYALETDGPYTSQICEHGYIAFAPQGIFALSHKFRFNQRQLNSLGKNLFAIMTAQYRQYVRFLQSQPFVEGNKIGFYGCSYGGTTAMFIPPNVPEIGPTVCSANFNYWNFKCANGLFDRDYRSDWQYEVFDYDLANTFDHSDMARLIAPRPFMVERGHDDGVAYDEYVGFEFGKVRYYYDICLKMPERAEIHFEPGGHFPFLTHALPFLDKWLK